MRKIAIIGCGQTKHTRARDDVNEAELNYEAVELALVDAGINPNDISAVIYGSAITSVQEGIENLGKLVLDSVGGYLKPHFRVQTGGTVGMSAVISAFYLVLSGEFDVVLASAGILRAGASGAVAQKALSLAAEPIYRRGFSGGAVLGLAMTFKEYISRYSITEEQAARCVVIARDNASKNPYAHLRDKVTVEDVMNSKPLAPPLKLLDMCPTSIGSGAVIVASEDFAKKLNKKDFAYVKGFASYSEPAMYPDRDILEGLCVRKSAEKAYKMAGITNPKKEIDVVELYNAASYQTMHWAECLYLCEKGEGGKLVDSGATELTGNIPINPSGGVLCTNNGSDAAMLRVIECALQVRGKAEQRQVEGAKTAVAMGWGGAQQFAGVVVLGSDA